MAHFVLDVSVKETSVCVVDDASKVILEQKVSTEPADIIVILSSLDVPFGRNGIEAGPLSQWLVNALTAVELPVVCVETRHMKALLRAQHKAAENLPCCSKGRGLEPDDRTTDLTSGMRCRPRDGKSGDVD